MSDCRRVSIMQDVATFSEINAQLHRVGLIGDESVEDGLMKDHFRRSTGQFRAAHD